MRTLKRLLQVATLFYVMAAPAGAAEGEIANGKTAQTQWGSCLEPYQLQEGQRVELRRATTPSAKLKVWASERVAVKRDNSTVPTANQKLSGKIRISGGWQMRLAEGDVFLSVGDAKYRLAPSELEAGENVTLVATDGTLVDLNQDVTVDNEGKLDAGTMATLTIDNDTRVIAILLRSASLRPFTNDYGPASGFVRAEGLPSPSPPNTLEVRVNRPGLIFGNSVNALLRACIQTKGSAAIAPTSAAIERIQADSPGAANLIVAIPDKFLPVLFDHAYIGVMLTDGRFLGQDDFWLVGFVPALAVAVLVALGVHFLVRRFVLGQQGTTLDWFRSAGQKPSLSLFQIYLWTWVVFLGCTYVAVLTGDLLAITWQVLALLGIAGAGSLSARSVEVARDRLLERQDGAFSDIFKTEGNFDLYKFQMFVFTVFAAIFVIGRVLWNRAFPELDNNLLLLLGISNGIYVGSKVATAQSPFRLAEQLDADLRLLKEAKDNAEGDLQALQLKTDQITQKVTDLTAEMMTVQDPAKKSQLEIEKSKATEDKVLLDKRLVDARKKRDDLQAKIANTTKARSDAVAKLAS